MKNLLKLYLWPLIKRFKALFITMAVLTAIGITSLITFNGLSKGINENWNVYVTKSDAPHAFISTSVANYGEKEEEIEQIEGVSDVTRSVFLPCSTFLVEQQVTKSTQLFTFDKDDRYKPIINPVADQKSKEKPNIYVEKAFADLNKIKVGDTIKIGYFEKGVDVNVYGIIAFPDTIVYGASNAISTENTNFGRLYIDKAEVSALFATMIDQVAAYTGPYSEAAADLISKLEKYKSYFADEAQKFANRLTIYFDEGVDYKATLENVRAYVEGLDGALPPGEKVKIIESYLFTETLAAGIIESSSGAIRSAGAAISIFVFATTIIVLTMFLLQIIKDMMRDIGVMSALGIRKEHIMGLLAIFSLIITAIGAALGIFLGHLIEYGLDAVIAKTFQLQVKAPPVRWGSSALALAMVLVASQFATFNASFRITKLSPVDALNDQASNKKAMPKSIDKKLQHASPMTRLTVNSLVTKPKRFITSFLAIFATGLIIFTSIAALTSFKAALDNTFDKYINYEAQVVFAGDADGFDKELDDIGAKDYELTKYASVTIKKGDKSEIVALQGLSTESNKVIIPVSKRKTQPIPGDGITVNMITAKALKIKEGDTVFVNDKEVNVAYISKLEAMNMSFCNIEKIDEYASTAVPSYLINEVDKEKLISRVTNYHYDSVITFTADQRNYFTSKFQTLEMSCMVFIAFSIGLGVLIVSLMMQTSLIEQKREICIMKSVGFSMVQISNIWLMLTLSQFILSMIFAIPLAFLTTKVFLSIASTKMAMVMSYANFFHVLITLGIVAAFLLVSLIVCMAKAKKWNIAENTKNRE